MLRSVLNTSWREQVPNAKLYCNRPTLSDRNGFKRHGLAGHCHYHWNCQQASLSGGGQITDTYSCTMQSPSVYNVQGFWYFARSQTREIQAFQRNPAKFPKKREIPRNPLEIFPNTCRQNICILILAIRPVLFTSNVQIYLETSSLQRINNVPKLLGVLRLMLRKTGH